MVCSAELLLAIWQVYAALIDLRRDWWEMGGLCKQGRLSRLLQRKCVMKLRTGQLVHISVEITAMLSMMI